MNTNGRRKMEANYVIEVKKMIRVHSCSFVAESVSLNRLIQRLPTASASIHNASAMIDRSALQIAVETAGS